MREIELKPCPFCGGESVYVEQIGSEGYFNVCCRNCLANVPLSGSRETAVSAWNCRSIDLEMVEYERLKKENAELKKILACWQNARLDMLARAKKLAGIEEEVRNGD